MKKNKFIKLITGVSLFAFLTACTAGGVTETGATRKQVDFQKAAIEVNSVSVGTTGYLLEQKAYVELDAYKTIYPAGAQSKFAYTFDEATSKAKVNNKDVDAKSIDGKVFVDVEQVSKATGGEGYLLEKGIAYVLDLPDGVEQITPEIPDHGAHYVKKTDFPMGPIYGTLNGKLEFIEYKVASNQFKKFIDFQGDKIGVLEEDGKKLSVDVPIPTVNHLDFFWAPTGHTGMKEPHLDIHLVYDDKKLQ